MKNTIIIKALTLCTIGCNSSTPKCNDTNSQDYKDGYMAGDLSKSTTHLEHIHNGEVIGSTEFSDHDYYNDCYEKGFNDAYYKK